MLVALLFAQPASASESMSPPEVELTLAPGESETVPKVVTLPDMPQEVDVVFVFDLTNSMADMIDTARDRAGEIMSGLDPLGIDIRYGVISHMDYPDYYESYDYNATYGRGKYGDYAYQLDQSLTNDGEAVRSAIGDLDLGHGADYTEDYTRVFYESYADPEIGWRTGAKKILVNFGDDVPHDDDINEGVPGMNGTRSTGGDPGRDEVMFTEDDLDLQTVLSEMSTEGIVLLECHTTEKHHVYWKYWTGLTGGGFYLTSAEDLVNNVVDAIVATILAPETYGLHLTAEAGYEDWVSCDPEAYGAVAMGSTVTFNETITVPLDAHTGTHTFTVSAVDEDGVSYGDQTVTVHVENVAPEVHAGADDTVGEGDTFTGSGYFIDYGSDAWDATVDYGDGAGSQPLTLKEDKTFDLRHTYSDEGVYMLTVTVSDDDEGTGEDALTVTVRDMTEPEISDIEVKDITETSATVTWKTDEPSTSVVEYRSGDGDDWTVADEDDTLVEDHSLTVDGLQPGTTYQVRVRSMDASGNEATSDPQQITTLSSGDDGDNGDDGDGVGPAGGSDGDPGDAPDAEPATEILPGWPLWLKWLLAVATVLAALGLYIWAATRQPATGMRAW
jgi:hypothetical protein